MIEVGKTVKHIRDSRIGEVKEIKDARARVAWEDGKNAKGEPLFRRTWVRFKDLQLLTQQENFK